MSSLLKETLSSHAAIFFVLFIHGGLIVAHARRFVAIFESAPVLPLFLILAFGVSLAVNTLVGVTFSLLSLNFSYLLVTLVAMDIALIVSLCLRRGFPAGLKPSSVFSGHTGLLIVIVVLFIIMTQNGGLIDILADSWWHMTLANKIQFHGTVFLDRHHLLGTEITGSNLSYEPAWHTNLALLIAITGLPVPLLWHALAPWCVMLSLCGYYLLAFVLTGNKSVALFAVVLFAVTLGGLNSYFRVSPWPGNVAYIFWYFLLFMSFWLLSQWRQPKRLRGTILAGLPTIAFLVDSFQRQRASLIILVFGLALVITLHLAELVWYVLTFLFYGVALNILKTSRNPNDHTAVLEHDRRVIAPVATLLLVSAAIWTYSRHPDRYALISVVTALIVLVLVAPLVRQVADKNIQRFVSLAVYILIILALAVLIDFAHLRELFFPSDKKLNHDFYVYYIPKWQSGLFGELTQLPYWEHQLRTGLLFSGVAGVVASVYLILRERTRASVFLFANCFIPMLVLITPYLFTYIGLFLPVYGVYRVQLLIFHPLVVAYVCFCLYKDAMRSLKPESV
jgi:hypothetical protein